MKKTYAIFIFVFLLVVPLAFSLSVTNNLQYNLNASKVNLTYDQLNRITQKNATTEQFNYSYDTKNGTVTNITHTKGIDKFNYDDKYRVITESRIINGVIFNKTYVYDASNRIISINLTSGTMLNYSYTNQSTLDNISGIINHTTHSVNNQPINRTYTNNLSTTFSYNETTFRLNAIETGTRADVDSIQNFTYTYDNTSNILQIIDNANDMTYIMSYDDLNRLTYANRTGTSTPTTYEYNYSYDSINNLLSVNGSSANISFYYNDTPVHAPKTIIAMNYPPTHETPILNATWGRNITIENLSVYAVDTYDNNFDDTKNIINWYRNTTSLLLLNVPMDGGSNTTRTRDYSGFNNTINVFSSTWFKDEGYDTFGAYNFTVGNTSYMNISYNQTFNTTVWTIETWVYPHTNYAAGGVVVGKWKSVEQDQFQLAYISGNRFRCGANNFTGFQAIQSAVYNPKNWYHVACTYDGANITIYVNGNKDATANISRIRNNDAEIQIGARRNDQFFNGTIDDVRIWNYSLPWEQINFSYSNRTDVIYHTITDEADLWQASVTPNDRLEDGSTLFTNTLLIRSSPSQDDPILNSTYAMNWTTENLTVYNTSTFDAQNDQIKNIITWYRNNTPMLVFYAPMEGGSNLINTKDYGGYNVTINVVNATWRNNTGYDGFGAYNFTTTNPNNKTFLDISNNPAFNLSSWTITAWTYPHSADFGVAVGKFSKWQLSWNTGTNGNRFRCGAQNTTGSFIFTDSGRSTSFLKRWSHVACVFNGTNLSIYVNGRFENSTNVVGGGLMSDTNELQIGCRRADQCFNGSVDDVQIWNGSLSWEQINYTFNNRTDMLAWSMTVEGETWNATISPNDRTHDGEIRTSKALRIGRLAEVIISEGTETMNSTTYNTTLTVINEPIQWLNSTNYNTTLGWTVYG